MGIQLFKIISFRYIHEYLFCNEMFVRGMSRMYMCGRANLEFSGGGTFI